MRRQHYLRNKGIDDDGASSSDNQRDGNVETRQQLGNRKRGCYQQKSHDPRMAVGLGGIQRDHSAAYSRDGRGGQAAQ